MDNKKIEHILATGMCITLSTLVVGLMAYDLYLTLTH